MEIIFTFNYLAIIAAAVISVVCGGMYVNLFKKQWAKLNGFTEAEAKQKMRANPKGMIGIFLANLAMAIGTAYLIYNMSIVSISGAIWLTFWLFVGFVGPLTIAPVLWEGKTIKLWFFGNAINIICLFVMILILAFWR